jgi:hypothetical protein
VTLGRDGAVSVKNLDEDFAKLGFLADWWLFFHVGEKFQ